MNTNYELGKLERLYADEKTSHLVHFILTLITGGLWIVIWLLSALATSTTKARYEKQIKEVYEPKEHKPLFGFFTPKEEQTLSERRAELEARGLSF